MKKNLLFAAVMLLSASAYAQQATGTLGSVTTEKGKLSLVPMAGVNLLMSDPLDVLPGATVGVGLDWQVGSRIALSTGLLYSYQRYRHELAYDFSAVNPNYVQFQSFLSSLQLESYNDPVRDGRLEIPLTVSAYVWKGLAIRAGIQANYRLHSGMADHHEEYETLYSTIYRDTKNTGWAMHEFYFALPVGISYEYRRFVFDVRYIFGLQDLRIASEQTISSEYMMPYTSYTETTWPKKKVNKLQFTLGYRFGL